MRNYRLSGPHRARFPRPVADGNHEVEPHILKLLPRLAPRITRVDTKPFLQHLQRVRIHDARGLRPSAVRLVPSLAELPKEVFGKDAPRGIACAEKKYAVRMVSVFHRITPSEARPGPCGRHEGQPLWWQSREERVRANERARLPRLRPRVGR